MENLINGSTFGILIWDSPTRVPPNAEPQNDPQIIANNFNNFCINVGTQLINSDSQYKKYINEDVCSNFK